jgi:7-cyano-7-deazaguanine synthase
MSKIKHDLNLFHKEAFQRILPTIFKEINEIKKDEKIVESFQLLKKTGDLSPQYEWLACYAKELELTDLEISYEKEISDPENTTRLLTSPYLLKRSTSAGEIYRLNEEIKESEIYDVYGRFNFPVYFTTKNEMQELAKKAGFFEILKHSWFCLMPVNNQPCGKCHPCRAVYLEGLKWRLPLSAKLRFHTWPMLRKVTKTLGIYNRLRWK